MKRPDLSRIVETFFAIRPFPEEMMPLMQAAYDETKYDRLPPCSLEHFLEWQRWLFTLRREVAPVVKHLETRGLIDWYFFLFHDRSGGVPTHEGDSAAYVHLRLHPSPGVTFPSLSQHLPPACLWPRPADVGLPTAGLSPAMIAALRDRDPASVWQLVGERSESTLRFLDLLPENAAVPRGLIAQILHFEGNGLGLGWAGVPHP